MRQALRSVLPDIEELTDEDLHLLFMKIDANGSGDIDWDEFTGFLLQVKMNSLSMHYNGKLLWYMYFEAFLCLEIMIHSKQ